MHRKILISIVVPIYNAGNYLRKCVESILMQSYNQYELILINDGSLDNSGKICDEFADDDSRIRVFHKKNEGVSSARNLGIEKALGEYICFIDADDWVETKYLETFVDPILYNGGPIFVLQGVVKDLKKRTLKYYEFDNYIVDRKDISLLFTKYELFNRGHPFSKLYHRETLLKENIRFDININYSEDLLFMLHYIKFVKSFVLKSESFYHYNNNNTTSLKSKFGSFQSELHCFINYSLIIIDISKMLKLNSVAINNIFFKSAHYYSRTIQSVYRSNSKPAERIHALRHVQHNSQFATLLENISFKNQRTVKFTSFFFKRNLLRILDLILVLSYNFKWRIDSLNINIKVL